MALLEVRDLRTEFATEDGVVRAVDGVSFAVDGGRAFGLVGESGCGKSVTALSLLRLVPDPPGRITGGRVLWKGRDLLALPAGAMPGIRGREIAMIFQDPHASLNPVMTVERQMREVIARRFGERGAAARRRALDMLARVDIADPALRLASYPHELSGGMQQRIMIAMALLCAPGLLIADEPTTALDVTIQAQILGLIRTLQHETGAGVLFITHDMAVIAEVCDEVAVMYAGRIVEHGAVAELFARPRHPYTRGLLLGIPRRGLTKAEPLPAMEGAAPAAPVAGCPFADRCDVREERCRREDPPLREVAPGHGVACHFPREADR
ncbi:MAG TPA: ABC transporter ATP-binding protein [Planctomycetota bacterium]|nr:ABC transporter ATP-binding protein [Planctomycetota bacterium]OQC20683.1 MAG: Oligopeptide transport ATP-binding protein OppD [Planctomycetes bacterium ADurb.Bin069]HNR98294.1 ABC transporter ATP-binding protein [Planctomycetota bacterium]HNU24612.1 ABC transporter ATP-binding protein [Planctomycetota bacterium]HOE28994.1 ABC transporter ATP-binding protein [Planctomycetota bacterium]